MPLAVVVIGAAPSAAAAPSIGAPAGAAAIGWATEAEPRSRYRPPVEGTIVDPFRAPTTPYGPGNRGIDYATAPLSPVRASAAGDVIFAGPVAGALHITIRHPDGLRTSYSFLAEVTVREGQRVAQGQTIGRTGEFFHFGVRAPAGTYLDPALLFAAAVTVHLVPSGDDGATPTGDGPEPAALRQVADQRMGPVARWLGARVGQVLSPADVLHRLRAFAHYAQEVRLETHALRLASGLEDWAARAGECTAASTPVPRPTGRRILVEVAGIGSTSDQAAVTGVDTGALGYAAVDVLRFSYRGGRVPALADGSAFSAIAATAYDARDSQDDLHRSGARLAALLVEVARRAPGVPIDVVAHSQGGVVARLAVTTGDGVHDLPPEVRSLVTLGSPHQGTNAATAVDTVASDPGGAFLLEQVQQGLGIPLDPQLPAARQLSQVSPVIDELGTHPVPPSVRFTSIGARGDLVVPAGRTTTGDPSAHETIVPLEGIHAHDGLPAAPAVTREIGLAVAGREPTCRSLAQVTADLTVADAISWSEDTTAMAAGQLLPGGPP